MTRKKTTGATEKTGATDPASTETVTAATDAAADQTELLLQALEKLIAGWAEIRTTGYSAVPRLFTATAEKLIIEILNTSEFDPALNHLVEPMAKFAAECFEYLRSESVEISNRFADAIDVLFSVSEQGPSRGLEPVAQLLMRDLASSEDPHSQIARMYGKYDSDTDKWTGPFFNDRGLPDVRLIEAEAASPGSVVPPGFNPLDAERAERRNAAVASLAGIRREYLLFVRQQREASGFTVDKDPATVEQLLREGQFPDVIASVKGVSERAVRDLAARLQITIRSRESIINEAGREAWAQKQDHQNGAYIRGMSEPTS